MTLNILQNGQLADADEVMDNFSKSMGLTLLNKTRQTIDRVSVDSTGQDDMFSEAYTSSNGQNNSVSSDTSTIFDTNKMKTTKMESDDFFVIIEATSISNISDFKINDCNIIESSVGGAWLLYCYSGTAAVKKAQVMKTLFYGTTGSNPRASATYITGITALKSSDASDADKRGHFIKLTTSNDSNPNNYTGTFTNIVDNVVHSWSNIYNYHSSGTSRWEVPSGTVKHSVSAGTTGSSELSTDTSADDENNPANCQLEITYASGGTSYVETIILCNSTISWASSLSLGSVSETDFTIDNSIPLFIDGSVESTDSYFSIIQHTIPTGFFNSTASTLIGKALYADWESGVSVEHKIQNATEDSGWVADGVLGSFTAFTSEPTKYLVKLTPKSSPTTGYPSIKGSGVYVE